MLESVWHQGTGLHWQGGNASLRLLPVIPSGDAADAAALWLACAQLQRQGYAVVVLDGTQQETASNPGLQDLLQPRVGYAHTALPVDLNNPARVATLPAARGLVQLAHRAATLETRPVDLLYRHVRNHAVVVLWAPAALLAPMLHGCSHAPVQLVPAQRRSVIASYRTLKAVFMDTGLMPRLVAMRPQSFGLDPVLKSLSQCAMRHLHSEPLCEQFDPMQPRHLQRWALQCLEQAETLSAPETGVSAAEAAPASPYSRSH